MHGTHTADCLSAMVYTPTCEICKTAQRSGRWGRREYVETVWIGIQFAGCDSGIIKKFFRLYQFRLKSSGFYDIMKKDRKDIKSIKDWRKK